MAKNIEFMGAVFPDVPSIRLPQHEGGLVSFDDTTDANATAADIAQGKTAYVNGEKLYGENVAPSGSQTFTENGTFDVTSLAEAVINVAGGGGGGMEFEVGEWIPTEDVARGTIEFPNAHSEAPVFIALFDARNSVPSRSSNQIFFYFDFYKMFGNAPMLMGGTYWYSLVYLFYRSASTAMSESFYSIRNTSDNPSSSDVSYPRYWTTESEFHPYGNSESRYWRAGRTYKWLAIWKPSE